MCISCGCGRINDKHGDDRSITLDSLEAAAEAHGIPLTDVYRNIMDGWDLYYTQLLEAEQEEQQTEMDKMYQAMLEQIKLKKNKELDNKRVNRRI